MPTPSVIPSSNAKPIVDEDKDNLKDLEEYGYGMWIRFLTTYPTRLLNGKDAPWYFVARLTKNNPGDNTGMGDRMLAIW